MTFCEGGLTPSLAKRNEGRGVAAGHTSGKSISLKKILYR